MRPTHSAGSSAHFHSMRPGSPGGGLEDEGKLTGCCLFITRYTGCVPAPLTSILSNTSNSKPNLRHAHSLSSWEVPGACPPNWLQGKAMMLNPSALYLSYLRGAAAADG